jgi:aldehyde:ferredoxin oxidoreductase
MKGVWNRLLRVDLTNRKADIQELPEKVLESFIGGAGLGAWVLWEEVPAHVKAFDPENRIVFAAGPFQGSRQTGSAKWTIVSKSPAFEANATSCATWKWGIDLKNAGYDALVVHGKADAPVYIRIDDDEVAICDAAELWGKDGYSTEDAIQAELGKDFSVSCIGPSGEQLAKYACIITGKCSFAGRGGLGAVMGSKNLKAVAVRGSKTVEYANPEQVKALSKKVNRLVYETDQAKPYEQRSRDHGTSRATPRHARVGNLPVKNWQLDTYEGYEKLGAPYYAQTLNAKPHPCPSCTLACKNYVNIPEGPYPFEGEGPEYESYAMMGHNLMITDIKAVAYAGHLANIYGLDTISLGACLAWAFESFEKGVLTKEDTYGLELTWGNADAMVKLTEKIVERKEGLGFMLGEGLMEAVRHYGKGSEAWAVFCNGLEMPAHDPRSAFVAGLSYLTGVSCGGNHEKGNPQHIFVANMRLPEFGIGDQIEDKERHSWENASKYTVIFQHYANIIDSMVHCKFMDRSGYTMTHMLDTYNAITGLNWDFEDLLRAGERIFTLQRLLQLRYGRTIEHNKAFPQRIMEPKPDGYVAGVVPEGILDAVDDYYRYRGWDENGVPTQDKIREVGLEEFVR